MTTKARKGAAEPLEGVELERPVAGGSYVRQADGTLDRVEFTDDAPVQAEPEAADTAPPVDASEGA